MIIIGTVAFDDLVGSELGDSIFGLELGDRLQGLGGDDLLDGGEGDDVLRGDAGADTLVGGLGNDVLNGGTGDDVIDGGSGRNRASYYSEDVDPAAAGVTVSLLVQGGPQDTGGQGVDTLTGIQDLAGSLLADHLTGDARANFLQGWFGNDTLVGGDGDDLLEVSHGHTVLQGGRGIDTASFYGGGQAIGAVTVSLEKQGVAQMTGAGATTTLFGIENLSGSAFDDVLTGDAQDNVLAGDDGADTLVGGKGDDTLFGDGAVAFDDAVADIVRFQAFEGLTGSDVLDGGKGKDTLVGGGGPDLLIGGEGRDRFVYLFVEDSLPESHDVIADLERHDIIDLSAIDADANVDGDQAFHLVPVLTGQAGQLALAYDRASGITHLTADLTGDGVPDFAIELIGDQSKFDSFVY